MDLSRTHSSVYSELRIVSELVATMATTHHIWFSRTLAGVAFAMFLVLTPKVWIDTASSSNAAEEVPVQTLEPDSEFCLWCEPATPPPSCSDSDAQTQKLWLNPDAVVNPLDLAPCVEKLVEDNDPSS